MWALHIFGIALEVFIGYLLLTDRVPEYVYNLLWYRTTGYFSRSVPDPDKRWLRYAGALMIVDGGISLLGFLLPVSVTVWVQAPVEWGIVLCFAVAFVLPWVQPFQKSSRDQQWKEMVLDKKDDEKRN